MGNRGRPSKRRHFVPAEDALIRQHWPNPYMSAAKIGAMMERDGETVRERAKAIGMPSRAKAPVPCMLRDAVEARRKLKRRTWANIAAETQLDPEDLYAWGNRGLPTPDHFRAPLERWLTGESVVKRNLIEGLLIVTAANEDIEEWLYLEFARQGYSHAAINDRMGILTPAGLVREANARRLHHGLPPYRVRA